MLAEHVLWIDSASGAETKLVRVMFPAADVPVVQLSLQHGLNPATHLAIGRALKPLRKDAVLILGSGQSYRNMRGFFTGGADAKAEAFDVWLREAMVDGRARDGALIRWEAVPSASNAQGYGRGVRFGCVLADAGYGMSAPFRQALSERGLSRVVDIPGWQKVYPADVAVIFPISGMATSSAAYPRRKS